MNATIHRSFECEYSQTNNVDKLFETEEGMANDIDRRLVGESGIASHFEIRLEDEEVCEEPSSSQTSVTQMNISISENGHTNARICYWESDYDSCNDNGDCGDGVWQTDADDIQNEYICDTCNQGFRKKKYLIKHIAHHIYDRKLYKCRFCPKELSSNQSLRAHETLHTDEKLYECKVCKLSFRLRNTLQLHVKKIHCSHAHYICEVCGLSFHKEIYLKRHSTIHTGEKKFECKYCEKTFRRSNLCSKHMRTQHQRLTCDKCDLIFSNRTQLKRHQTVHLDRPFKCDQCEASFTQNTNLTKHKVIHSGIKPYKCTLCGKAYAHKSNLNKHYKERHSMQW